MKRIYAPLFPVLLLFLLATVGRAQDTLPELVKRAKPTVVAIATFDAAGEPLITGGGVFLWAVDVVTNVHVIRGAARAEIKTLDGKGKIYPVKGTLSVDEEGDLALL